MNDYKVILTGWVLAQLEGLPTTVIRGVVTAMPLLGSNPNMFEVDARYRRQFYRRFHVVNHRVYYRVDDERGLKAALGAYE